MRSKPLQTMADQIQMLCKISLAQKVKGNPVRKLAIDGRTKVWGKNTARITIVRTLNDTRLSSNRWIGLPTPEISTSSGCKWSESLCLIILELVINDLLKRHLLHVWHNQEVRTGTPSETPNLTKQNGQRHGVTLFNLGEFGVEIANHGSVGLGELVVQQQIGGFVFQHLYSQPFC